MEITPRITDVTLRVLSQGSEKHRSHRQNDWVPDPIALTWGKQHYEEAATTTSALPTLRLVTDPGGQSDCPQPPLLSRTASDLKVKSAAENPTRSWPSSPETANTPLNELHQTLQIPGMCIIGGTQFIATTIASRELDVLGFNFFASVVEKPK